MAEFGHHGVIGDGFCIDSWGAGPFLIDVNGKQYRFEDSDRFGPYFVGKRGQILDRQPGDRHPFWEAHDAWRRQGRRLDGDLCIWKPFTPDKVRIVKRGRKSFVEIIEEGDDPSGAFEVVETIEVSHD